MLEAFERLNKAAVALRNTVAKVVVDILIKIVDTLSDWLKGKV